MIILRFFSTFWRIAVCAILLTAQFFLPLSPVWADVFIIGNKSISATNISPEDIQDIFLGKKTKLSDRSTISFVIQKDGDTHQEFLKLYIKRSESQFKNYWKRMLFTGKGSIPQSFASDEALIKHVSETKGVIGYVSKKPESDNIKIINIE